MRSGEAEGPLEEEPAGEEPAATQAEAGDETAGLDCNAITFIVPYSPGGGSDRQVRRLQPHLEEILDVSINVVYQTGGDGAVGWQALAAADPDGCTVGNVVAPNIVLLSVTGEDVGFQAEDFSYISWTETTPNALAVPAGSSFETIEQFVEDAQANPGARTIAGVGEVGELLVSQILEATGIDISFVPVTGGVGDIVPQLLGGHVDAGIFGASHVLEHEDTLRALAISGEQPSEALPDVPTFQEAGWEGVLLTTSWGVAAPPGTSEDLLQIWNEAIIEASGNPEVVEQLTEEALTPLQQTPEEAEAYLQVQLEAVEAARAG